MERRPGELIEQRVCRLDPPKAMAAAGPNGMMLITLVPPVGEADICSHWTANWADQ
jgi:hypothetical protein